MKDIVEGRVRKLSPKPGDVLIFRMNDSRHRSAAAEVWRNLHEALKRECPGVFGLMVGPGVEIECFDMDKMEQFGWVRFEDALKRIALDKSTGELVVFNVHGKEAKRLPVPDFRRTPTAMLKLFDYIKASPYVTELIVGDGDDLIVAEAIRLLKTELRLPSDKSATDDRRRLARFILDEIPGEPSETEGAVDTAIRLLRRDAKALKAYFNAGCLIGEDGKAVIVRGKVYYPDTIPPLIDQPKPVDPTTAVMPKGVLPPRHQATGMEFTPPPAPENAGTKRWSPGTCSRCGWSSCNCLVSRRCFGVRKLELSFMLLEQHRDALKLQEMDNLFEWVRREHKMLGLPDDVTGIEVIRGHAMASTTIMMVSSEWDGICDLELRLGLRNGTERFIDGCFDTGPVRFPEAIKSPVGSRTMTTTPEYLKRVFEHIGVYYPGGCAGAALVAHQEKLGLPEVVYPIAEEHENLNDGLVHHGGRITVTLASPIWAGEGTFELEMHTSADGERKSVRLTHSVAHG